MGWFRLPFSVFTSRFVVFGSSELPGNGIFVACLYSLLFDMFRGIILLAGFLLVETPSLATVADSLPLCPMAKLKVERLPDLHLPRGGHSLVCAGNEMVAVGGHTTGFIPTATAEYFSDGQWHLVNTLYPHDDALAVVLLSGKVLLAGGHDKSIGIGQTFPVELYDPDSHSFEGIGSLDQKRTLCQGVEIDSGRVVISGNWYGDDGIEMFDGKRSFTHVKEVAVPRASPHIFRIAPDDVLIVGAQDTRGERINGAMVDRLRGEPYVDSLLLSWHPLQLLYNNPPNDFIGDTAKGVYAHLVALQNDKGQVVLAMVSKAGFELLPTDCPVPSRSKWGDISYFSPIIVDSLARKAYLVGNDEERRLYVLSIDYKPYVETDKTGLRLPMALKLFYTDPMKECGFGQPSLTPEGNLMMAGGIYDNNFMPYNTAFLLMVGNELPQGHGPAVLFWAMGGMILALVLLVFFLRLRKKSVSVAPAPSPNTRHDGLMPRIHELMNREKLYLKSDLKVSEVATLLGSNSRYVSDCIKQYEGVSFTLFVNRLRIEHAKQLMRDNPDAKIMSVYMEAGFASESSFFRTFKSITGMTPRERLEQNGDGLAQTTDEN